MGFIDAVYILDQTEFPVLHHKLNPDVPSFNYIYNQLLIAKRELLVKDGINIPTDSVTTTIFDSNNSLLNFLNIKNAATNNYVMLDPVIKIDSDWLVSWCKVDDLYLLSIGTSPEDFLDIVSDNEEEEEEEEEEENGEYHDEEEEDNDNEQNLYNSYNPDREEYSSLSDNEIGEEIEESEIKNAIDTLSIQNEPEEDINSKTKEKSTANISNSPNPLQYIAFLDTFSEAIKLVLQTDLLSAHKIQINSHRIVMLLQELLDASVPFISDMNQLRELLPNDSIINKIVSATKQIQNTATSSISTIKNGSIPNMRNEPSFNNLNFNYSTILEKSGNLTPWRKAIVKNSQNEIFVDLYETIDLIIESNNNSTSKKYTSYSNSNFNSYDSNKNNKFVKAVIHGHLDLTTSLSGNPTVEIQLNSPFNSLSPSFSLDDCYPSLHRSIDKQIWKNSNNKIIELTPPDEKSKLLTYHIDLLELKSEIDDKLDINKFCGAIGVELHSGLGINMNEFEIIVNTGCGLNAGFGINSGSNKSTENSIKEINGLVVEIFLPTSTSLDLENNNNKNNKNKNNNKRNVDNSHISSQNLLIDKQHKGLEYGANQNDSSLYDMKVLRSSTGTVTHTMNGSYEWKLDSDVVVGGVFTLRGSIGNYDNDDNNDDNSKDETDKDFKYKTIHNQKKKVSPRFLRVRYKHHGTVPSGTKIQGIKIVSNENAVKPFKGVKYTSKTGELVVR